MLVSSCNRNIEVRWWEKYSVGPDKYSRPNLRNTKAKWWHLLVVLLLHPRQESVVHSFMPFIPRCNIFETEVTPLIFISNSYGEKYIQLGFLAEKKAVLRIPLTRVCKSSEDAQPSGKISIKTFGLGKLWTKNIWAQNIFLDILRENIHTITLTGFNTGKKMSSYLKM